MNLAQDPARLIVLLLSVVAMLGIVGYGFASGNLDAFLAALFSEAWNQVTLADLYISFWLMGVVMFVFSPRVDGGAVDRGDQYHQQPVFGLWLLLNLPRLRKAMA